VYDDGRKVHNEKYMLMALFCMMIIVQDDGTMVHDGGGMVHDDGSMVFEDGSVHVDSRLVHDGDSRGYSTLTVVCCMMIAG
jgi:hypothetical protein